MDKNVKDLVEVSRFYGNNPAFVIAGGGNTSYKSADKLWVKASGSSMATIDEGGFVCLSREKLSTIVTKSYSLDSTEREAQVKKDLHDAILYPADKRPSVETSMHEIIEYPFVVHTHPTLVNALMCSNNAKETTKELFGEEALFVEYTDPGYVLFKKVESELIKARAKFGKEPTLIFLENHGVFVGADSAEEIKSVYTNLMEILQGQIVNELPSMEEIAIGDKENEFLASLKKEVLSESGAALFTNNELVQKFVASREAFEKVNYPFTPDDIVYCKSKYLFVSQNQEELANGIKEFTKQNGYAPKVVAIQGLGLLTIEENEKSAQTVQDVFLNMMKVSFYAESFGGQQFMTQDQIDFIDNWEVENYRRQVAKKG